MKQYSVAQLKRDAKEGILTAVMTIRGGERVSQEALPERLRGARRLIGSNTTSLTIENLIEPSTPSCVWLPKASLIEYTDTYLRIYSPGYREPTDAEQQVLERWKKIERTERYQQQLETDCLTDGSVTYYQKLAFFQKHDMEYLMGCNKQRGLCLDYNRLNAGKKDFIQDEAIKGKISLEYQIERLERTTGSIDVKIQDAAEQVNAKAREKKTNDRSDAVR